MRKASHIETSCLVSSSSDGHLNILSVESQKGTIAVQTLAIDALLVLNGTSLNIVNALLALIQRYVIIHAIKHSCIVHNIFDIF